MYHSMSFRDKYNVNYGPCHYYRESCLFQVNISRLEPPFGKCDNEYSKSFEDEYGYKYNVPVHIQKTGFKFSNISTVIAILKYHSNTVTMSHETLLLTYCLFTF